MSNNNEESNVINFNDAKSPHIFHKKEDKLAKIKKAFKAARAGGDAAKESSNKESSNKKRKKKKGGKGKKS